MNGVVRCCWRVRVASCLQRCCIAYVTQAWHALHALAALYSSPIVVVYCLRCIRLLQMPTTTALCSLRLTCSYR
jgi:hypothetical protein